MSRNDSVINIDAFPSAFKKNTDEPGGDSFCSAWTSYYVFLRITNPIKRREKFFSYMFGNHHEYIQKKMFNLSEDQSNITRGRWCADRISGFIRLVNYKYKDILLSSEFRNALDDL